MTDMQTDWRYSDERMDVRTQGLNILLNKFGSEICSDGSHATAIRASTNVFTTGYLRVT